jgi:hypothetical protein
MPANAGIQVRFQFKFRNRLNSGFRRNDGNKAKAGGIQEFNLKNVWILACSDTTVNSGNSSKELESCQLTGERHFGYRLLTLASTRTISLTSRFREVCDVNPKTYVERP